MGEAKKKAHQALYRKYRSKSLSEIVGQEHITKTLANAIAKHSINHAYLFTGPKGVGKTSIARILAHEINELPYTDESTHLDIIEIDAASNRRIDDIRDLREKVHIAPVSAQYKVYIIDEVHMLTAESFNALLKTLEEPPSHVVFILATTEVHKLPATIISRTQRHSFRSIPTTVVAKHLKDIAKQEAIIIDDAALTLLAEHGEGSFRDSISLLDQMSSSSEPIDAALVETILGLAPHDRLQALLLAVQNGDAANVLAIIGQLVESGLTPAAVAKQLLGLLRNSVSQVINLDTVTLMDNLLSVSMAAYPQLRLEVVLLQAALAHSPVASEVATNLAPSPPPPVVKEAPAPVQKPAQNKVKKTANVSTNLTDNWSAILQAVKKRNNPLYTVLRLARPSLNGTQLQLSFGFTFHQKRADDIKHKAIVAEEATTLLGQQIEVVTIVDSSLAAEVSTSTTSDPATASLVAQVQDIMGGGEVVNV